MKKLKVTVAISLLLISFFTACSNEDCLTSTPDSTNSSRGVYTNGMNAVSSGYFAVGLGSYQNYAYTYSYISQDGINWTNPVRLPVRGSGYYIHDIVCDTTRKTFVAVGGDRILYTSDGISWRVVLDKKNSSYKFLSVSYNKYLNLFCATSTYNGNRSYIFVSSDGINWVQTKEYKKAYNQFYVTSLGSLKKFIIEGSQPMWSSDGYVWNSLKASFDTPFIDDSRTLKVVTYNEDSKEVLALADCAHLKILRSTDGINFSTVYENTNLLQKTSQLTWNRKLKKWLALVEDCAYVGPSRYVFYVLTSNNGVNWLLEKHTETGTDPFTIKPRLRNNTYGAGLYCNYSAASTTYYSSTNGLSWSVVTAKLPYAVASTDDF